jgi:hypothetical protein
MTAELEDEVVDIGAERCGDGAHFKVEPRSLASEPAQFFRAGFCLDVKEIIRRVSAVT